MTKTSKQIEEAIHRIQKQSDESTFIDDLLQDALNWPLGAGHGEEINIDDISYDWDDVLEELDFESEDAPVELRQLMPFPNWPHGIFIIRFGTDRFFTQSQGLTTPLRNILRILREKVRSIAPHPTWAEDHLLFICHNKAEHFQFARFTESKDNSKTSKLQMFGWGPNDYIRTVCEYNLKNLIYKEEMSESDAIGAVEAAFDVSRVSKQFYEDYKSAFEKIKPIIAENSTLIDDNELHQTTQTLFNRLLFLRFIEKKGWLKFGNDDNYLKNLFLAGGTGSNTFYNSRLRPLFFQGLAVEGKQEHNAYGEVPFLNGGLFEKTDFDRAISDLPNESFEPLLSEQGLFYRYNFTVQESTPLDVNVAIDPEMIGTMFEELVTGRNEKGAFYTPRVVVAYMCREAIKSLLEEKTEVNPETIHNLIDKEEVTGLTINNARSINSVLSELKAIDPACGSGAYLLGLLHELVRIHTILSTTSEDLIESRYNMKLRIISRSIYGVDLDSFATNIAMLRLWLSLSVEATDPYPLPNLDFNIETGDSLLAPDPSTYVFDVTGAIERADSLAIKKENYLKITGDKAKKLRTQIKSEESEIRKLLRKKNDEVNSVDFRVHFASIFTKNEGFDIVLANPPYVAQADIEMKFKDKLHKLYSKSQTPPTSRKSDLYCYFYVRSMQLLRKGGIQIFICSNSWLDTTFGGKLQRYFLKNHSIKWILQSAVEKQFASAEINTIISMITKSKPCDEDLIDFVTLHDDFKLLMTEDSFSTVKVKSNDIWRQGCLPQSNDYHGSKWSLYSRAPPLFWAFAEKSDVKIGNVCTVNEGKPTGANPFFFPTPDIVNQFSIPEKYLSPGLMKTRGIASTVVTASDCPYFFFHPPKNISSDSNLLEYLNYGHENYLPKSKTLKSRGERWHYIPLRPPADLLSPCGIGASPFCAINNAAALTSNSYTEFRFGDNKDNEINNVHAFLNHPIGWLCIELFGRTNLGGGMLKVDPVEYRMMPIKLIDTSKIKSLIARRKLGNVFSEVGIDPNSNIPIIQQNPAPLPDRVDYDIEYLKMVGFSSEKIDELYKQVCLLFRQRQERARRKKN